jgi:NAD(P)-dependent dehydrogenase (short-subunit alcohol dehydrogenase family)
MIGSTGSEKIARPRALITGGRRGIGRAIAWAFADDGYDVIVNDLVQDSAAAETLAGISARGVRGAFVLGNISEVERHGELVQRVFDAFGGLEVLVNNAGISVKKRQDMLDVPPESFDALVDTNLRGPFFLTQAIARRWIAGSPPRHRRSIINIASVNSEIVAIDRSEYCIAKTGVSMMTELYAVRLAEAGVGVFEIRPGIIRTDMTAVVKDRYDRLIEAGVSPVRRWGEPEEIGKVAAALARGEFHFSTGSVIHVDGGMHIHRV